MKTNELKRGFTLVELLSVIGILAVLVSIGVLSYIKIHNNALETTLENKKTIAKTAALKYGEENKDEIWAADGSCVDVSNYELIEQGYLTSDSKDSISYVNPVNGKELNEVYNICFLNGEIVATTGKYRLSIDPNGGIFNGKTTPTVLYMESPKLDKDIDNPIQASYNFKGWKITRSDDNPNFIFMKARWEEVFDQDYIVKYDCNGGTGEMFSEVHTKDQEKKLSKNECSKIKIGSNGMIYEFLGWSLSNVSTKAQYTDEQVVKNINAGDGVTLYAVWQNLFYYSGNYEVLDDYNYRGFIEDWKIRLLSDGNFVYVKNINIDVFLVGGGGGGGYLNYAGGGGGGGGYTASGRYSLIANKTYLIKIGAGGVGRSIGSAGGSTTAFDYSAGGGKGAIENIGAAGGSGGGNGAAYAAEAQPGNDGGSDGSSGNGGGKGQGKTTREFGEINGILYAGGGGGNARGAGMYVGKGGEGGGANPCQNALANTGGGGGGGHEQGGAGSGGSGIVVIRNVR